MTPQAMLNDNRTSRIGEPRAAMCCSAVPHWL